MGSSNPGLWGCQVNVAVVVVVVVVVLVVVVSVMVTFELQICQKCRFKCGGKI
jgi:hypothetical protein